MVGAVWANFDADSDGKLNRDESLALISDLMAGSGVEYKEEEFVGVFEKLDAQGDGFVSK